MTGFVSLVGAGPGDPELLTLKAADRLRAAEVVLYDALVNPEILRLASRAQLLYVGKRAGRPAVRQETIQRLMIRRARRNQRVVRLKGGDPFLYGRGGEEALALLDAGIPFEVVPGVSSALAAPALAGIPVTHRGTSSSLVVVAGYTRSSYAPVLSSLAPGSATVVVLMGLATRRELAALLLERGWAASTPAALLRSASTPDATEWVSTLGELASTPGEPAPGDGPGILVIGEVVALARLLGPAAQHPEQTPVLRAAQGGHHVGNR